MFFDIMQEILKRNLDPSSSNKDEKNFDDEDETPQESSESEKSNDKSDLLSKDEVSEELEDREHQDFNLEGSPETMVVW